MVIGDFIIGLDIIWVAQRNVKFVADFFLRIMNGQILVENIREMLETLYHYVEDATQIMIGVKKDLT